MLATCLLQSDPHTGATALTIGFSPALKHAEAQLAARPRHQPAVGIAALLADVPRGNSPVIRIARLQAPPGSASPVWAWRGGGHRRWHGPDPAKPADASSPRYSPSRTAATHRNRRRRSGRGGHGGEISSQPKATRRPSRGPLLHHLHSSCACCCFSQRSVHPAHRQKRQRVAGLIAGGDDVAAISMICGAINVEIPGVTRMLAFDQVVPRIPVLRIAARILQRVLQAGQRCPQPIIIPAGLPGLPHRQGQDVFHIRFKPHPPGVPIPLDAIHCHAVLSLHLQEPIHAAHDVTLPVAVGGQTVDPVAEPDAVKVPGVAPRCSRQNSPRGV